MNSNSSGDKNKIKRRNFFYYIGAAAITAAVSSVIPFRFFKKDTTGTARPTSSIKVKENPYSVKRGSNNG
jgi:hypothetical protein